MGPDFKLSLKAARINAGFEAREVAEKIGVAKLTVYHWENGTAMPSLKVAQKLRCSGLSNDCFSCHKIGRAHV